MIKVHIISDLNLGFNEFTDPIDETIPNVDLVIINGNIGLLKRGMLYAETLCHKYPHIPFVYNLGERELYWGNIEKFLGETETNLNIRKTTNTTWPKNLYWDSKKSIVIDLPNGRQVDIFCAYGFPKIYNYEGDWADTIWHKNYVSDVINAVDPTIYPNKPKDTSLVNHGILPIWATIDWVNQQHTLEETLIRKWELSLKTSGILVTHINPYKDERCMNQTVGPYQIHLNNGLWVTSNTIVENVKFLGAKLVSNPGRGSIARSKIVHID